MKATKKKIIKESFKFTIDTLLHRNSQGKIVGPFGPVEFMKAMGKQLDQKLNRLWRVNFEDQEIFNIYEDGHRLDKLGLTGHDTVILGTKFTNDLMLCLWVDMGVEGMPVAMAYDSDRDVVFTPRYEGYKDFEKKLTKEQVTAIFKYIFDHPECQVVPQRK